MLFRSLQSPWFFIFGERFDKRKIRSGAMGLSPARHSLEGCPHSVSGRVTASGTGPGRLLVVKPNILERKWQLKQGGEYSFSLPLDLLIPISSHIIYSWTQFAKERECRLLLRNSQLKLIGERGESMWAKT